MSYPAATFRAPVLAPVRAGASLFWTMLLWGQGLYYLATGVWPLLSLDTFERVTGPKTDHWLVQTVGVLITVMAGVLLVAAWRRQTILEVGLLALGSALALGAVDVVFVAQQVIPPIYLADAGAEAVLLIAWLFALANRAERVAVDDREGRTP